MRKKILLALVWGFCHIFYVASLSADSSLTHLVAEAHATPPLRAPFTKVLAKISKSGVKELTLFAYGSLVDYGSARRTLSAKALLSRRPAIAYGLKRLFDRDITVQSTSVWGLPLNLLSRAMLNVRMSHNPNDIVNGVLIDIPINELSHLIQREVGYDLVAVVVSEWDQERLQAKEDYRLAWTFSCPHRITLPLYPRPGYYELTRDAAKQYGSLFAALWFLTTYCADGTTPIWIWEAAVNRGEQQTLRRKLL